MQYGIELTAYKRDRKIKRNEETISRNWYIMAAAYFAAAFLISRVILINNSAPFGIAFIISVVLSKDDNIPIVAGCGALMGYITIFDNIANLPVYVMLVGSLVSGAYYVRKNSKRRKFIIFLVIIFIENVLYNFLSGAYSAEMSVVSSAFEIVCILPIYYMIHYAVTCIKDIKTRHIFNNEEIISMAMVSALVISGTWGASLWGLSIRNILAFVFVIICGYVNGSSTGAAAGVAMGLIVGMTTENIAVYISGFGLCGLAVGLFKETGKYLSAVAFIVSFFILKLYSNIGIDFKLVEVIIAAGIMLSIPTKIYNLLLLEFNWEKKMVETNDKYIETIKDMFVEKLSSFSDILFSMSGTVKNLVNNDKLLMKNKSSAMVENLADRVCANCSMNSRCWKKEIYYTYADFSKLIQNFHDNSNVLPEELMKKCIKQEELIENTQDIINNFITNEMWRGRMVEGRQLVAGHLRNMGETINEIVNDFNSSIEFNGDKERYIKRMLNKKGIDFSNVFCFKDKHERVNVRLTLNKCRGSEFCIKELLPIVNQATALSMCIIEEDCKSDIRNGVCTVNFEETPKFHVASHVVRECKAGEKFNGDSYSYGKLKDGTYMMIISDGMGSGPEAGEESKAAVELIERFSEAGFSTNTAVNTVNSIMTMKFSEEEKFSTLDIANIDLYSGDLRVMKIGAVATYIKGKENVEVINSKTLPIGVLDKVDVDITEKRVKDGDIIIMLSDGVLECEGNNASMENWIISYLENCSHTSPKTIADEIANRVKEVNNGKAKDDMTIIASKVYNLY